MKNNIIFFSLLVGFFMSCDTDFNINADWEEVTVVFGLLDQSQDKQFIRINKAFLGNESALIMDSNSDSLNYSPEFLEVKIQRFNQISGNVLEEIFLEDTVILKDDGIFASDENIVYFFNTGNFLKEDFSYRIIITNLLSGNIVTSETKLINNISLMSAFNNPAYKLGFYNQLGDYSTTTVEWNHALNASIYQVTLFLNYTEYAQDTIQKTIYKIFPSIKYSGNSELNQQIDGEDFFNFIENNIESDPLVTARRINDVDLLFSAASSEFETYINLNKPPTGIVQERPLFTNIDNGIGLFSSRYNKFQENILLTSTTKEAISNQFTDLKFLFP